MADDKYLRNQQKVYDLLKGEGYTDDELGGSAENLFKDRENASLAFQALSNAGYSSLAKDEDDFVSKLYAPESETQVVTAPTPVRSESQRRTDRFNDFVRQREAAKGREIGPETPEQEAAGKAEVEKRMASQAERIARTQKPAEEKPDYTGYDYKALEEEYARKKEEYAPLISEYEAKMNVNLSSPEDFVTSSWLGEHNTEYNKAVGDLMAIGSEMASRPEYKSQETAIMEQTDASDEAIKSMRKDGKALNGELMAARLMNKKTRQLASQPYSDGGKKDALGYLGSAIWDYGKGTLDRVKTAEWLSRGLTNFVEGVNLRPLQEKLQKMESELKPYEGTEDYDYMAQSLADDRLTEEDKVLLASYLNYGRMMELRENNVPLEYRGGQMFADTAGYMIDFLLTRRVDAVGRNAMGKALGKWAPATLFGKGIKAGALELGGAFTRTLSMVPQTLGQIGDSMTEMENVYDENGNVVGSKLKRSVAESVADGLIKEYIEVASEGSGEIMQKAVGTAISRYFKRSAIPKTIIGRETREFLRGAGGLIRRGQIQGLPYEDLEEILGGTANTALAKLTGGKIGDEDALKQTLSKEAQQEMLIGFLPFTAVSTIGSLKAANRMQENYNESMRKWEELVQAGAGVTEEDLNNVVDGLENKSTEDLMKSVANINDKIRKSGVGMQETEVRDMMNKIIAGRLAYDLQGELWDNSEDRMALANAYAETYGMPVENNLYDITKTVAMTELAANNQGFTDEELGRDASVLMLEAEGMEERGGREAERAETLKAYAMAKAQQQGITDGYQKETADMLRAFEEPIMNLADNDGTLVVAQTADGQEVYVASKDAVVGADGKVSAPTGPDGLVSILYGDGSTAVVKANTLGGAQQLDTETYLMDKEYEFNEERAAEFQQAQDTISASGMANAVGERTGQTVYISGNGAYEPVRVERMTHGGEYTVISGDKEALKGIATALGIQSPGGSMLEAPTTGLYEILAKDDDGSISTDMQAGEQAGEQAAAPQEAPAAPAGNSPEDLVDTKQTITYKGQPLEVTVLDVSDGTVIFEDGDGLTDSMPVNEFYSRMQAQAAPAPAEEPAPAPATEPEQAPAATESGIPVDEESGEPIYDAEGVTPEQAYNDIYGRFGEDTSDADSFVVEQSDAANKALNKAKKASEKAESEKAEIDKWKRNPGEGLNAFAKRKADAKAEVDKKTAKATENIPELKRKADFWGELREVADANIAEAKAEAERQKLIEQYGVDPSGFDLTPQTMEESLADGLARFFKGGGRLSLGSVLDLVGWNMLKDLRKGGYGFVLSRKQEAVPVDKFVMSVEDEYPGLIKDEQDAINMVGDLLMRNTRGELGQFIFNARLEEARRQSENEEAPVEETAVEEAPVVTEEASVEEPQTTAEEPLEDLPEEAVEEEPAPEETPAEEAPVAEPEPAPAPSIEKPVQETENKPEKPSESPEISVTSQEGEKGVPATASDIKDKEQARAYFESLYGKGKRADNSVRVWELAHKEPKKATSGEGMSKMAMLSASVSGLSEEEAAELITLGTQLAEDYITEDGFVKFPQFFKNLVETFGDGIRPFSKSIYLGASANVSDEIAEQMDDRKTVRAFDTNIDINNINDEQDDTSGVSEPGQAVPEPVSEPSDGNVPEAAGEVSVPEPGSAENDGNVEGAGADEQGGQVGDGGESVSSTGGRRSGGGNRPGTGRGRPGRSGNRGGRNRGDDVVDTETGQDTSRGVDEVTEEAAAKAEAEAYSAEKEAVKDETDTNKLKKLKDELKSKISAITEKINLDKAKMAGRLRAVIERLRDLFSNSANKTEALAQEKVPYQTMSDPEGSHAFGSVVPSGSADYMRDALRRLEKEEGKNVADFVKDELGYKSLDEMFSGDDKNTGLSSEQVDSVGLAIHQMKNNKMFIVGDMTGVGKGRQGAALIRWAVKNGKKVLFVTEKPDLFSDMYGDIMDIGGLDRKDKEPIPWIVNNDSKSNITTKAGEMRVRHPGKAEAENLYKSDSEELPTVAKRENKGKKYDFVMMTYSQAQSAKTPSAQRKLDWIKRYAKDAIVVMDESHNAAGDSEEGKKRSNRAIYFEQIVRAAQGITFMSATFAKRPGNMLMYALRSSMSDAQMTTEDLINAISEYGVPMQEILASSLFKTGEMVRRERDFTDVAIHWNEPKDTYSEDEIKQSRDTFDLSMGVVNSIIGFQRAVVDPIIKELNAGFKEQNDKALAAIALGAKGTIREYAVTPYSSQVSNVANLMFYAIKARKAADMAIEQIKKGEKPVIAVENTLESYLRDIDGDVNSADFTFVLNRGLARSLNYRYKETVKQINKETGKIETVDDESTTRDMGSIESMMGPDADTALKALRNAIAQYGQNEDILPLMLSPIDYIKKRIEDAGYKCGEITGRSLQLVNAPDGTYHTEPFKADKKKAIRDFNGGEAKAPLPKEDTLDALILNTAGATGISLHASRRFGDQRKRTMIILQPARDPNTEVQVRGRVDRTGQVIRAEYFYITSPIPAERKVIMMLRQKLASLDANSVGTENVSSNRVNADDMDNKYGDEVARQFLIDHPEINAQLDDPLEQKKGDWEHRDGLLYQLLIGIQRMTCSEQEMILEELQNSYKDQIEYLNQNGINDLATTTMNLEATTIDKGVFIKGKDNESMSEFAHDTNIERDEVNVLKKPLRSSDIYERMRKLGALKEDGTIDPDYGESVRISARGFVESTKNDRAFKHQEEENALYGELTAKYPQMPTQTDEEYEASINTIPQLATLRKKNQDDEDRLGSDLDKQLRSVANAALYLKPGMPMLVPLTDELSRNGSAPLSYGRFIGFKVPKDGKPKSIKAVFAVKDSRASIELPVVSKADVIQNIIDNTYGSLGFGGSNLRDIGGPSWDNKITDEMRRTARDEWWDRMIPKNTSRSIRYMVTGNILQACGSLGKYKGTITTFTRKDPDTGEITVERGMLLAEDFDPENFMVRSAVTKDDVWEGYDQIRDDVTNISVQREGDKMVVNFDRKGREKLANHPITKDDGFKELIIGKEIEAWSKDRLRAYVEEKNVEKALEYLYKNYGFTKGHLFVMPDSTERPDAIVYTDRPYNDVINEFEPKYGSYWGIDNKIKKAVQQYKMDVNNEELKNRIREMVQLRQAFLRKRYAKGESSRLAWQVIIEDQNIEQAKDDKDYRDASFARREAIKEELETRGIHGNPMHFESGKNSLDTVIKTFNKLNKNETNAKIAKKVFDIAKKLNLDVIFNEKIHNNTGGQTAGDMVEYNWKYMNAEWITDQMKADTFLHELMHTATVYAKRLVDDGNEHLLTQNGTEAYDAVLVLNALYDSIRRNPNFTHKLSEEFMDSYTDYGVQDWFEMMAEAGSNENFRDDLKKVKVSPRILAGLLTFTDVTDKPDFGGRTQTAWDVIEEQMNILLDNFNQKAYTEQWRGTLFGERAYKGQNDNLYREGVSPSAVAIENAELKAAAKTLDRMEDELGVVIHRVSRSEMPNGHRTDKGYYDPSTGEMTICMDNVTDERDAIATVLHEAVGHKGLRELFGPRFREAMTNIYASLDRKGRAWVNGYIASHGLNFGEEGIVRGMEEYMAHLAESGDFQDTVWDRIKEIIGKIVDLVFGTDGFVFTDRELNYILRASYEHLKDPNWLNTTIGKAKDTLWKRELGINETDPNRPTDPDGPGTGILFRDVETGVASEDYNDEMELWHNKMIIENQNADLPVKIGMEKVVKETGKNEIREDEDYLRRHNVASSRAESEAHNFELFHFTPLLETVRAIQEKLISGKPTKDARQKAYERTLDYIYAVSGLERNAYKNNEIEQQKQEALEGQTDPKKIAKISAKYDAMKRDWAGITSLTNNKREDWQKANADAQALVDDFKAAVGQDALLDELWDRIRSCTDYSLEHAYKYGLLTREEFERLHGTASQPRMWEYYVPLRGFNEETAEEVFDYSSFLSPSNDGAVVKKMKGRWTKADNPLANILNIAESEIVQGNDNWAKQALYRFTLDAGENTLLSQVEPWYVKNPATGTWTLAEPDENESLEKFEERMQALADMDTPLAKKGRRGLKLDKIMANKAHRNEHMIRLKVRGVEKMIWVNGNPALAKAVTGVGRSQNMQWLRRASRVLSNLFTTYSLDFSIKNLIRDTIYSRTALIVKEDKAYRRKFAENWRKNFGYGAFAYPMVRLAADWESGKLQSIPADQRTKKQQMFIDFMTDGGQTGYTIINSVNEIKKSLERSMRRSGKDVNGVTVPILGHYAKAVKTLNEGFELLTRFTAYETSRDMGRSGLRSASDAKEISVNFNRRGAQSGNGIWGNIAAYLGATHYFYNAGVQGFENFLRLFKTSPKKMGTITVGIAMMGILTPLINSMFAASGGGDDDWYWNLPEWVRRNNLILGTGRSYLAIPLPVEFRAIYGLGDIAAAAFCYQKYPNRTFGRVAGDMISTASGILPVNPVEGYTGNGNFGDAVIRAVAPDAGMFFVDWATNRDYTGRPLWKENPFSDTAPKSQGAYASTPKGIVNACQKLAQLSAGAIDVPPGLVRDFMNNYGGGFFRAAEDISKIMTGVIGKDPDRPFRYDNIPFLSGFTGHIDEDRSNSFATNALREYKDISDGIVKKVNAICNTKDITAAMVYGDKEIPEEYASKVRVQRILSGKDYRIGKEYRDGMNNKYKMKQYVRGDKIGQWYKSKEVEEYGINSLKQAWKDLRDEWAAMPHKTEEEKSARAEKYLEVDDAWHKYYDAEGDLAEKLMKIEYGKK